MVELKETTVETFKYAHAGNIDCVAIQSNFDVLTDLLNDVVKEVNTLKDRRKDKFVRTVLMDSTAPITILEAGDHENLKIVSGFVIAADTLKMDQTISIINSANQALIESKTIKSTERSGKAQSFEVIEWRTISKFDDVYVIPSSRRKVVVSLLLEEV